MKEEELVKELKSRMEELENVRSMFYPQWMEIEKYVASSVSSWSDLEAIPEAPKRFASQPCKYCNTLVSGLVGYSISPSIKWFALSLQDDELLDIYGVKKWLEKCEKIMVNEFNRSNLYKVITPCISDYAILGHGCLYIGQDPRTNNLYYEHRQPKEIYLDVNSYGEIDTVFRHFKMSVRQMYNFFGYDALNDETKEEYDDVKRRSNKHDILFAVYPREEYDYTSRLAKDMPYAAIYVDIQKNYVIEEKGYNDFPYSIFEFKRMEGYAYSESIAKDALEDVKALNICIDTSLKIAQTAAEPPLKASDHLKNVSVRPRSITRIQDPSDVIDVIRTGENYPITLDVVNQFREIVKDDFNVDFFLMLQQSTNKQKTATEVMEMQGEKAAVLSDLIVSLNDALQNIIKRSFNILMRSNKLPPPPEQLRNTGAMMKVDFIGPLAQAQKRYYSAGTVTQAIQQAIPIMQAFPNAGDFVDADEVMKKALEASGMPQSCIREDKDVEKLRKDRAEQEAAMQQQAMAMEQQKNLMQNMNKLNEPLNSDSVLGQLDNQMREGLEGNQK